MQTAVSNTPDIELPQELKERLALEDIDFTDEQLAKAYNSIYNRFVKRIIDFCLALVVAIVLSPFLLVVAVAIASESGLPILYRADRGGYRNSVMKINKFRTMVKNADQIGGGTTALNDRRITGIGAYLRKLKIDELPQVFNILGGSMSWVGPRPELLRYTSQYEGIEKNILNVRPGITDYSSLTFINLDEIVGGEHADEIYEKYVLKRKNQLRLKYVANVSFTTDCRLFFATVLRVLKKAVRVLFKINRASEQVVEEIK